MRAVARGYFEPETGRGLLEDLAVLAGLTYYSGVSKGHSQGDWADVFLVATPAWLEETGVEPENAKAALEAAFKLWGHWAWGNVWYLSWLTRPDGSRVDPESCHGVYGDPEDEDSGGPDVAREESEADARGQALEAAEAASWAARDSITLPA